jgi:hypothetical protein
MHCMLNGTTLDSVIWVWDSAIWVWDSAIWVWDSVIWVWDSVIWVWDLVSWARGSKDIAYAYIYHGVFVCAVFMIYFLLHDLKASSFSIPRLYATGLGDISVLWHEVTYIWQCCFFVLLSKMPLFYVGLANRVHGSGSGQPDWPDYINVSTRTRPDY